MVQAPSPERRADRPGRAWSRWLAAGTFVVGLVAGALLVGLLGQDPPVPPTAQEPRPTSAPGSPPTEPADGTPETRVNAACLRAINAAQDIAAAVDDLGAAAAALDAARLDEEVRRLQPLQQRLRENSAGCEVTGPPPGRGPTTTSPPAAPTD
ncbi:hypothetical protein ACI79C_22840 [Geodermatophilus sp. SYSU D00697]